MKPILIAIAFTFLGLSTFAQSAGSTRASSCLNAADQAIYTGIMQQYNNSNIVIGDLMLAIGEQFLGTPYVGHTLETANEEVLIANLSGLDCTTFVEYVLAMSRTVLSADTSANKFKQELQLIRYRSGMINGYSSRLHYFSDWLYDGNKKQLISFLDHSFQRVYDKEINFMSSHPNSYAQLKDSPAEIQRIKTCEDDINKRKTYYIPKAEIAANEDKLKDGDIIGLTSSVKGLDVAHVGIIVWVNHRAHMLHASSQYNKVVISKEPLADYLNNKKTMTGIMVARPEQ